MKSNSKYKALALLTVSVFALHVSCFAAGSDTTKAPIVSVPITLYDSLLVAVAEGNKAKIDAETYKEQYERAREELESKESVITWHQDKNKQCDRLVDTLQVQLGSKDFVINTQRETIKRLGTRPKYWTVSLVAGYGYGLGAQVTRMPFVGVAVGRTIFKF